LLKILEPVKVAPELERFFHKRSTKKKHAALAFIPTNLIVQLMHAMELGQSGANRVSTFATVRKYSSTVEQCQYKPD
jgi:hypothetical protein